MPLNTRFNGAKRPDLTGIISKRALDSLAIAFSQPLTRKEITVAQSLLSISALNNRRSRNNRRLKKQINRGGNTRVKNRNRSPSIEIIAAQKRPPEEISTASESDLEKPSDDV